MEKKKQQCLKNELIRSQTSQHKITHVTMGSVPRKKKHSSQHKITHVTMGSFPRKKKTFLRKFNVTQCTNQYDSFCCLFFSSSDDALTFILGYDTYSGIRVKGISVLVVV